jgi:hypothetical protein
MQAYLQRTGYFLIPAIIVVALSLFSFVASAHADSSNDWNDGRDNQNQNHDWNNQGSQNDNRDWNSDGKDGKDGTDGRDGNDWNNDRGWDNNRSDCDWNNEQNRWWDGSKWNWKDSTCGSSEQHQYGSDDWNKNDNCSDGKDWNESRSWDSVHANVSIGGW